MNRETMILNALNRYVWEEHEYDHVPDMSWDRHELIYNYGWTTERAREGWPSLFG